MSNQLEASTSLHPSITMNLVDTGKYFCPFLSRGFCREATQCTFSHDTHTSTKIPTNYCHFYLANQCFYGQDCKFTHDEPDEDDKDTTTSSQCSAATTTTHQTTKEYQPLCPYAIENGDCLYPIGHCSYLHGLVCDLCGRACLHPHDENQRHQHRDDCVRGHEREMELSFAVQRSKDKVCGICMDTVVEKKPISSGRFGILEKCNHIFCLDCIRKWRGTKSFDNRTVRACPECRVCSDFVVPSKYWIEDQDDKDKLIQDYKAALRSKPCRYFNEGKGECPFAGSCFYKHAFPDGRLAILEPPKPRRKLYGASGSRAMNYVLWNILTSTDDDDWSNDELESLHYLDYATEEDDDDDDDYDEEDIIAF